ncbi:MAG TPA: amidohydrolase, partial [Streptosporangiaceae bacterium]|nr:amidohydrolase [Streptosporangiaceae bacterium]
RTPAHPSGFAQAVAVADSVIAAVGSDEEIRALAGPATRVIDLRGRLTLPAFGDAHVHPVSGGLESLRCNLLGLRSRQECLDRIAGYAAGLPPATKRDPSAWVLGGGWSRELFPGGSPAAADLDRVTGGRPAFLSDRGHHSGWVNTAALAVAGIGPGTPDPQGGRIERDEAGRPSGTLHDGALQLVTARIPSPSPDELTAGLLAGQAYLHSMGITSYQDACVGAAGAIGIPDSFEAYRRAAAGGLLTARVVGSLWWDRQRDLGQVDDLLGRREQAGAGPFRATTVKLMLDGVCETFTAAMGSSYLDRDGNHTGHRGDLFIQPDLLAEATRRLAAEGFQLHFHAIGDRAVTAALDVLADLPPQQRDSSRHHVAHVQFIRPRDVGRFAEIGAVANFQPLWACHEPEMDELTVPFVGAERASWQYQIGSLARSGARIAFGSDWPVSSADPLQEIHVAVNRVLSSRLGRPGTPECETPFLPDQAITLDAALAAFTTGVAYVNHQEHETGRLLPGLRADLVVLDQDLYAIPAAEIGSTSVIMTVAGGRVVFGGEHP